MRAALHVARADLLERVRRPGFLITLVSAVVAASYFMPPNHSTYSTLQLNHHRGLYNSAWTGTLVALMDAAFLSFAGFYLVKNAVGRDRATGVGQILAATPLGRVPYTFGKFASNLAILTLILLATGVAAAVMQWVRAEDPVIRPLALLAPLLLITLPVLALVAAVAVLFEMVPWLRGGLGNALYFFLWVGALSVSSVGSRDDRGGWDLMGESVVMPGVFEAARAAYPAEKFERGSYSLGFSIREGGRRWDLETFRYEGARWDGTALAGRAAWIAFALGLTAAAALLFDRFQTAAAPPIARGAPRAPPAHSPAPAPPARSAAGLAPVRAGLRFGALVIAELRLVFHGVNRWWALVALGLAIAMLFAPLAVSRQVLAPIAWVWPLTLWSALGTRESRHGTAGLLFSAPQPLARQLPAAFLAGMAIAVVTSGTLALRFLLAGDLAAFATWLAGAAFVPALALALGVWSGSGKFFEVVYLLLWYTGPLNRTPALDYFGATEAGVARGVGAAFGITAAALIAIAAIGRARQARS